VITKSLTLKAILKCDHKHHTPTPSLHDTTLGYTILANAA